MAHHRDRKEKVNPRLEFLNGSDAIRREDCPCPKDKCPLHGHCEPCTAYHASKGQRPYCLR